MELSFWLRVILGELKPTESMTRKYAVSENYPLILLTCPNADCGMRDRWIRYLIVFGARFEFHISRTHPNQLHFKGFRTS